MTESKKKKATVYLFHHISSYLPLLEDEEFDALVEDIREFGQVESAILYEGKILDGRNRYRACKKLGIELQVREWKPSEATGITPLQYVISTNIMRRHLNTAQRSEIGLLLLEEEEKLAKERKKEMEIEKSKLMRLEKDSRDKDNETLVAQKDAIKEKIEEISKGKTSKIVAPKVRVSSGSLERAKKIKEIAKEDKEIAEDWEKAKKGDIGISTVFEKAKVVEDAQRLPLRQREEVMQELRKGEIPAKQLRRLLQEKKDDVKRMQLAKKTRELRKRKQEMDKLRLQIKSLEKSIDELENARKGTKANLKVLTEEVSKKYPKFASEDSDYILTKLSSHYDSLDMGDLDHKLEILHAGYETAMKPLREEMERITSEYQDEKDEIDQEKEAISKEAISIEKLQNAMTSEYDKLEAYQDRIRENKEKLITLKEKYDNEFKDL